MKPTTHDHAAKLLDKLYRLGIELSVVGSRVLYRPKQRVTPQLLAKMSLYKTELHDLLKQPSRPPQKTPARSPDPIPPEQAELAKTAIQHLLAFRINHHLTWLESARRTRRLLCRSCPDDMPRYETLRLLQSVPWPEPPATDHELETQTRMALVDLTDKLEAVATLYEMQQRAEREGKGG